MTGSKQERRSSPRLKMYAGVFILYREQGFLTEVDDVSTGGASVRRPPRLAAREGQPCRLYFVLEQDNILMLRAHVAHTEREKLGFIFDPGQAINAEQLVTESRRWR